jgi:integrase
MEKELDALICAGLPRTAMLLQLLKETGARIAEAQQLKWTDIDFERRVITITGKKGSNNRILPISIKLVAMLKSIPKINENIFQVSIHSLRTTLEKLRTRQMKKLNNPRLGKIHFHTFRHWKGTMEYHKTKDIIHVKTVLGHRNIENTMLYINIESALFLTTSDEWTCKATTNDKEVQPLIESGFEYHLTTPNGLMIFRKRK